jgi:hypothetical protein
MSLPSAARSDYEKIVPRVRNFPIHAIVRLEELHPVAVQLLPPFTE